MTLSDAEITDRLADAIRNMKMVVDPDGTVRMYCEDDQYEGAGKRYILFVVTNLAHWRGFFSNTSVQVKT